MTNFTFSDAVGSAAATSIFALVLYGPGFFLGFVTDLFNFRKLGILHQTAWAVAFSFGTTPLLLYLAGKFITLNFACGFVLLAGIAGIILAARQVLLTLWTTRRRRPTLILCCAWVLFVFASLLDIQVGHRLYFSVVQFDQSYRVAFTDAVMRTGVPPANPLYFAGAASNALLLFLVPPLRLRSKARSRICTTGSDCQQRLGWRWPCRNDRLVRSTFLWRGRRTSPASAGFRRSAVRHRR